MNWHDPFTYILLFDVFMYFIVISVSLIIKACIESKGDNKK